MNFYDSKLVMKIVDLHEPETSDYRDSLLEVTNQAIKPYLHYIKLLQDQIELRDEAIAELEARAKGRIYQCNHPDCKWYFMKPRVSEGGFKICPVCGAFSYRKLKYEVEIEE